MLDLKNGSIKKCIKIGFVLVVIITIFIIIMYYLGFRITYDPNIITDWDAVSAVAEWISIFTSVILVFVAAYLGYIFELKKDEIIKSNKDSIKLVRHIEEDIENNYSAKVTDTDMLNSKRLKRRIELYIQVEKVADTISIATFIGKDIKNTIEILHDMEQEDTLRCIGENAQLKNENLLWSLKE